MPKLLSFRGFIIAAASVQALIWLALVSTVLFSTESPGNKSIDREIAKVATVAFLTFGAPALVFASVNRWLAVAAVLALAPFAVLVGALARLYWTVFG